MEMNAFKTRKPSLFHTCDMCNKTFKGKNKLRRHIISHQNDVSERETSRIKCFYCSTKFRTRRCLLIHYAKDHNMSFKEETASFPSETEFKNWKIKLEQSDQCRFVLSRGVVKNTGGMKKWYLQCHRDGYYKSSVETRKKKLKSHGSNKIYASCMAQMIVTQDINGVITVRYVREHVAHSSNIGRLNLSADERASIAGRISEGVPYDEILNQICDSVDDDDECNVLACMTKQDLRNIKRDFNLYTDREHLNDFISVNLWYEKVKNLDDDINPVIYFKAQGDSCEENSLTPNDILLIIATKFQISMLQQFGTNIICIDNTHSTNKYDFYLTSIVIVDEYGHGIPVAFCISNKKDTDTWVIFFKKLQDHVGIIHARVFMSDLDNSFYNAWSIVMAPVTMRLLCTWHIDRAWRINLQTFVKNKVKRTLIYKELRIILKEAQIDKFYELLHGFLNKIKDDEETIQFGCYFEKFYLKRIEEWAYCHRQFNNVNTNMYMASLHKEFKYCYLQGMKNKHLNKSIDALLKLARDQIFKRMQKINKNESYEYKEAIRCSHEKAVANLEMVKIEQTSSSVWAVSSFSNKNIIYEVTKISETMEVCSNSNVCLLTCTACEICIHSYSCDCVDYVIKNNICKHIHLCVLTYFHPNESIENIIEIDLEPEIIDFEPEIIELEPETCSLNTPLPTDNQSHLKNNNLFEAAKIKSKTVIGYLSNKKEEDFSEEELCKINNSFDKIISIVSKSIDKGNQNEEPSNKKMQKQVCFESVKKEHQRTSPLSLVTPTIPKQVKIIEGLLNNEVENIYLEDFDHTYY